MSRLHISLSLLTLTLLGSTLASAKTITVITNSDSVMIDYMQYRQKATKVDRVGCKEYHWYKITGWFPKEFYTHYKPETDGNTSVFEIAKQSLAEKYCEAETFEKGTLMIFKVKGENSNDKKKEIIGFSSMEFGVSDTHQVSVDCKLVGEGYPQYQCDVAKFNDAEELELELNIID